MSSSLKNGDELTFKNPKQGDWFEVDFTIVDDQNTGYLFPKDPKKAMYVRPVADVTEPCPEDWNNPEYWPQFEAKNVSSNNRTLKVKNLNQDVQLFKFTLWVTKTPKDNGPCIAYDPIGSNQNGGFGAGTGGGGTLSTTTLVVGGVAVLGLVGLGTCVMWGR
jgi:hypothetical protein